MTVAARALGMDDAHALRGQARQFGKGRSVGEDTLRMAPDGELAVADFGERAGRADRAVHLIGPPVGRGDPFALRRGAGGLRDHARLGRCHAQPGMDRADRGQGGGLVPARQPGESVARADRLPFRLRHDADEAALTHDFQNAFHRLHLGWREVQKPRARQGRP